MLLGRKKDFEEGGKVCRAKVASERGTKQVSFKRDVEGKTDTKDDTISREGSHQHADERGNGSSKRLLPIEQTPRSGKRGTGEKPGKRLVFGKSGEGEERLRGKEERPPARRDERRNTKGVEHSGGGGSLGGRRERKVCAYTRMERTGISREELVGG